MLTPGNDPVLRKFLDFKDAEPISDRESYAVAFTPNGKEVFAFAQPLQVVRFGRRRAPSWRSFDLPKGKPSPIVFINEGVRC